MRPVTQHPKLLTRFLWCRGLSKNAFVDGKHLIASQNKGTRHLVRHLARLHLGQRIRNIPRLRLFSLEGMADRVFVDSSNLNLESNPGIAKQISADPRPGREDKIRIHVDNPTEKTCFFMEVFWGNHATSASL